MGFSHRRHYDGIAVLDAEGIRTPLGAVEIDREFTRELAKSDPKIYDHPEAFLEENSVEMQLPFLQMVLKDFKIVPVAIGDQSYENAEILGEALYDILKDRENFLLVASTDMSHYLAYKKANRMDKETTALIKKFDAGDLYAKSLAKSHRLMCGYGAVCATMIAAKKLGANKIEVLEYANSGDTARDKKRVVGYLSAAIVKEGERQMLNEAQRKKMLKLGRDSIRHYLKNGKRLPTEETDQVLNEEMGAFVTLHKDGRLRGCIGNIVGKGPFYLTVRDMAVEAATGDPRFPKVTFEEMDDIDIEISALSPLKKIDDPETIEMGRHGVIVRKGSTSGVYLPQVATETGWTREEFMNSLCGEKAGMPADSWKKRECDIYVFTAEVFGEKE